MTTQVKLDKTVKFEIDNILMKYWTCETNEEKQKCELDCYTLFKHTDYHPDFIHYLETNGAGELAKEMHRFQELHDSVPHEHEYRKAG